MSSIRALAKKIRTTKMQIALHCSWTFAFAVLALPICSSLVRPFHAAGIHLACAHQKFALPLVQIRAGTGGEEAALFAADLLRMYQRYAAMQRWQVSPVSSSEAEGGGYREVIVRARHSPWAAVAVFPWTPMTSCCVHVSLRCRVHAWTPDC